MKIKAASSTSAAQKSMKFKEGKIGKSKSKIPKLNIIKEKIDFPDSSTISKLLNKTKEDKNDDLPFKFTDFKFKKMNGNAAKPEKKIKLNDKKIELIDEDNKNNLAEEEITNSIKQVVKKSTKNDKIEKPAKVEQIEKTYISTKNDKVEKPAKVEQVETKNNKIEKPPKVEQVETTYKLVPDKLALDAINAVYRLDKQHDKKSQLFKEEGTPICLLFSLFRAPSGATHKKDISLPHKILPAEAGIIAIIPDDKKIKKHSFESASEKFKAKLKSANINCIDQVLTFKELKENYKTFEEKKRISRAYDLFLCDPSILKYVLKFLGQPLKSKPVRPFKINTTIVNLRTHLNALLHRATIKLNANGIHSTFAFARTSMGINSSFENLIATLDLLEDFVPGGKKNIQTLYIKTVTSTSVPLYTNMSSGNNVEIPVLNKKIPKYSEPILGDLSSFKNPKAQFKIMPEGKLIKVINKEEEYSSEDFDSSEEEDFEESSESEEEEEEIPVIKKKGQKSKIIKPKISEKTKKKSIIEDEYEKQKNEEIIRKTIKSKVGINNKRKIQNEENNTDEKKMKKVKGTKISTTQNKVTEEKPKKKSTKKGEKIGKY